MNYSNLIRVNPNTTEWHEIRRTGIGGSDASSALGMSKYKTMYQLWDEKRNGCLPMEDNNYMLWGRILEPVIRQQYSDRTGSTVRVLGGVLRDEKHSFMLANPDGITDNRILVEIKTARTSDGWGEEGSDEIPQNYLLQVQHYLVITKLDVAHVAVLIGGSDFRIYEIPADKELQEMLIDGENNFWEMVISGKAPPLVNSADLSLSYGQSVENSIYASDEIIDAVATLKVITEQRKILDDKEEALRIAIQSHMKESDTLLHKTGEILATWKSTKPRTSFDSSFFNKQHPELYKQLLKIGNASRRFNLK
jgi:putative phage-type endonuclease